MHYPINAFMAETLALGDEVFFWDKTTNLPAVYELKDRKSDVTARVSVHIADDRQLYFMLSVCYKYVTIASGRDFDATWEQAVRWLKENRRGGYTPE